MIISIIIPFSVHLNTHQFDIHVATFEGAKMALPMRWLLTQRQSRYTIGLSRPPNLVVRSLWQRERCKSATRAEINCVFLHQQVACIINLPSKSSFKSRAAFNLYAILSPEINLLSRPKTGAKLTRFGANCVRSQFAPTRLIKWNQKQANRRRRWLVMYDDYNQRVLTETRRKEAHSCSTFRWRTRFVVCNGINLGYLFQGVSRGAVNTV